jgi:Protein of unknown function (DUF1153)
MFPVTDIFPKRGKSLLSNGADPVLPAPDTKRWVARRKAVIVEAVHSGAVDLTEICQRYNLSVEEFVAWERAIERHGVPGLRVTRLQIYRDTAAGAGRAGSGGKSSGGLAVPPRRGR